MIPLGFRFDVDAVVVEGVAHRPDCAGMRPVLPEEAIPVPAAGVYRSERCPRASPICRRPFETLLSYQLERPTEVLARRRGRPFSVSWGRR